MEHARKMVVVPVERLNNLQSSLTSPAEASAQRPSSGNVKSIQTFGNNLSRLDNEMYEILNSKYYDDDYKKMKDYLQVLTRYLHFKNGERNNSFKTRPHNIKNKVNKENLNTYTILESIPKSYASKAVQLLNLLEKNDEIYWDESGVVTIRGNTVVDSNITELLNNALRNRKSISKPTGWEKFVEFVKEAQVPSNLLGNSEILNEKTKKTKKSESSQNTVNTSLLETTTSLNESSASNEASATSRNLWMQYQ